MIKKLALACILCLLCSFRVTSVEEYYRLSDAQKNALVTLLIEEEVNNLKMMIENRVKSGMSYKEASWEAKSQYTSMLYHMCKIKEEMHGKALNLHEIED